MTTSIRKPHNDWAGYVCERTSQHPSLPGHFVVLDRDNGGDWIDSGENRWIVCYQPSPAAARAGRYATMVTVATKACAMSLMKHAAAGGNDADFGQN